MSWLLVERRMYKSPKKDEPKGWELIVGFIILILIIKGLLG